MELKDLFEYKLVQDFVSLRKDLCQRISSLQFSRLPFLDLMFAMELIDSYDKEQILTRKRDVMEVNWPNRLVAIEHSDKSSGPLNCETNRMKEALLLRADANTMLGLIQSLQMILFGKYKPFLISTRES